jgi:hypothetical protein
MAALLPKADIRGAKTNVSFVPKADIVRCILTNEKPRGIARGFFLEGKANLSTCDGCNLELSDSASRGIPEPQAVNFDPARPVAVCIPTAMPTVAIFAVPIMAIVCFANNVFSVCGFIDVDGLIAMNVFVHGGVLIALNAFIYGSVLIAMNVFVYGSVLIAMNVILCRVSKSRRRH